MFTSDGHNSEEEEDDTVGQRGHGLYGVLDCGVALLRDVQKCVTLLCDSTSNL